MSAPAPGGEAASGRRLRLGYFVPPSKNFAGIERVTHAIADGLARSHADELEVHVIYSSRYPELDEFGATAAYRLHTLEKTRIRSSGPALRRHVVEHELDVLVVPQVELTVMAWLMTRGTRLRALVPHLHGNPDVELAEGTRRSRSAFGFFARVVAPRVPVVLAVSPSLRDRAARTLASRSTVVYVPNPVPADPGARTWEADPRTTRFVSVGRLSRQKGQDLLLRALAAARDRLPPFTLTVVGDGKERGALRALCSSLELDDVVTFAGYVTPGPYLSRADCFVMASRWEGFGVVLVEALQHGLPLLATDVDFGPRDVITDERIGMLVRPDDVDALADGLVRMAARERRSDEVEARVAVARHFEPAEALEAHHRTIVGLGLRPRPRRSAR